MGDIGHLFSQGTELLQGRKSWFHRSVTSESGSDDAGSMRLAAGQSASVSCLKGHIKVVPTDRKAVARHELCEAVS